MKAQLVKRQDRFDLYNESDGSKIASTLPNPMGKLSLKNCQAIENGYDLDELSWKFFPYHEWEYSNGSFGDINEENRETFKIGFQKALEILGDKKFSEDELKLAFFHVQNEPTFDVFKESLQQTEFDVEIEMEPYVKYVPKSLATVFPTGGVRPKLDADKCLILKIK